MKQKNPYLTQVEDGEQIVIDKETGEILDVRANSKFVIANSDQEFYLMFASMLEILVDKGSGSSTTTRVLAFLLNNYGHSGKPFAINKALKETMCSELGLAMVSIPLALNGLQQSINGYDPILYKSGRGYYRINPQHLFKGSLSDRRQILKAQLELVNTPPTSTEW